MISIREARGEDAPRVMSEKTIVITGASTGIGEACVQYLAERQFRAFAGVRKESDAERLRGGNVTPLFIDVTDSQSITSAADT